MKGSCYAVDLLLRRQAALRGDAFDVDAVLVGTGQQEHVVAIETVVASDGIGSDGGVGVANMGYVIGVINRGSQVVGGHDRQSPWLKSGRTVGKEKPRTRRGSLV